jgi:hypothetical protein
MKKLFTLSVIAVACTLGVSQDAFAREFADIYSECGLGATISPKNGGVAAVTNVTFDLGTTAVSSNISSPQTCAGGKVRSAKFIHESYDMLASDISRGEGNYLDSLVALSGKSGSEAEGMKREIRQEFAAVVQSDAYAEMNQMQRSESLFNIVSKYSTANS